MQINTRPYGKMSDGRTVQLFRLQNDNNVSIELINYGGIITSLNVPGRDGRVEDVIIGFDDLSGFLNDTSFINALIGRYGNRIGNARFEIDGKLYPLTANEGKNQLHGGVNGFHKVLWDAETIEKPGETGVKLYYLSKHMEEGYPGNLQVEVQMLLNNQNELSIVYVAQTDATTHINLTHHGYFNLTGGKRDILDHVLKLNASNYTETDQSLIATGRILPVKGTDYDFTTPVKIGSRIDRTGGYDLNYVIDKEEGEIALAAEIYDPDSGRVMKTYTDQPGVQFYSSTHFDGTVKGKKGIKHVKYFAFCLETQHFPNSPNIPHFPSTLLSAGEAYRQTTVYKFEVRND
ncbi:MAG: galactose mutarotase [Bacteroidales bacterium]|nr:galactose mutarotase [Bacteroidales bacterium]MBN2764115.1 galactose mutarotase [Bacteroidales bacterium]